MHWLSSRLQRIRRASERGCVRGFVWLYEALEKLEKVSQGFVRF